MVFSFRQLRRCVPAVDERAERRPAVHEGWPKVSPRFREGMLLLPKTMGAKLEPNAVLRLLCPSAQLLR